MDRGAWWVTVHGIARSRTRLSDFMSLTSYFITGEGKGNPLQYSRLENPMDRGAWQAMVHGVAESWTRLMWVSTHARLLHIDLIFWHISFSFSPMNFLRGRPIAANSLNFHFSLFFLSWFLKISKFNSAVLPLQVSCHSPSSPPPLACFRIFFFFFCSWNILCLSVLFLGGGYLFCLVFSMFP